MVFAFGGTAVQSTMDALLSVPPHKLKEELLSVKLHVRHPDNMPMTRIDWLEAIAAHPAIGDKKALREKFAPSRSGWEAEEQAAAAGASEAVLDQLTELNAAYREKNGFVFLVCASGKPADVILTLLKARLPNDRDTEIRNAAEEQRKITQLRFSRILTDAAASARDGNRVDDEDGRQLSRRSRL